MGPSIAIESNNLNPSHSGNTYPLRFLLFSILKIKLKLLSMACDQSLTCMTFPLRWLSFPIKTNLIAQWVHLFSMDFDDLSTIYLIFQSKSPFLMVKVSLSGNIIYFRLLAMKGCGAIRPGLKCFILMIISFT